jgi:putative polymerase
MNYQHAYPPAPLLPASTPLARDQHWLNDQRLITFIIVASVGYQLVLCLLNTHLLHVSRALVGLAEAIIMLACLPLLMRRLLPGVVILACVSAAMLCLLGIFNEQLNIKAFRDIAIPLCYFWLGCNVGRLELADRALKAAICVVLAMGFFELLLLDTYTHWFDIFSYYVSIGTLDPTMDLVREDRLQANGMRPEGIGRTLLPGLLGPHRVSSVFLEPVSLGNFASLCAAWGLARSQWREGIFFVVAAIVMMVLCDSRFALMTVSGFVLLRLFVHGALLNICVLAPIAAIALLLVVGHHIPNQTGHILTDDMQGRLAYSGWSLMQFDPLKLLGIGHTKVYYDEGYAHVLATFGLPLVLILWCSFWLLPKGNDTNQRFRAMASLYIALILCISGFSFFALKSAGLLWFLVGCSLQKPAAIAERLPYPRGPHAP